MSAIAPNVFKRGGRFIYTVEVGFEAFDFTGVQFSAQLRKKPGGELVDSLTVESIDTSTLGKAVLVLVSESVETTAWPLGLLYGDVRAERVSPQWGPFYSDSFTVDVQERVTIPA